MVRVLKSSRLAGAALASTVLLFGASQAMAAGDAAKGADVFKRCAICHDATKGGPNKIGPNLYGVVGRKAGTNPTYSYSAAMKNSGLTWTAAQLNTYLTHPGQVVVGTKMTFAGLPSQQDRDNVIAYLSSLK